MTFATAAFLLLYLANVKIFSKQMKLICLQTRGRVSPSATAASGSGIPVLWEFVRISVWPEFDLQAAVSHWQLQPWKTNSGGKTDCVPIHFLERGRIKKKTSVVICVSEDGNIFILCMSVIHINHYFIRFTLFQIMKMCENPFWNQTALNRTKRTGHEKM